MDEGIGYTRSVVRSDNPEISYTLIGLGTTIVKILFVDIVPARY